MPVFQLELRFDDKGTLIGVQKMNDLSVAANKAKKSTDGVSNSVEKLGQTSESASSHISKATKDVDALASRSEKAASKISAIGGALKGLAAGFAAAFSLAAINSVRKELVSAGSDAQETANKFNVVFSQSLESADTAVAEMQKHYGMSRAGAQAALSGIADLLTGLGLTQEKALELSKRTTQLGTDLASFTNYAGGTAGAVDALSKAMLGETEAAKSLGLVLNDTQMEAYAKSLGKVWNNLGLAEKAELRLQAAIKQSPNAVGDYARSMGSYANQVRATDSALQDFKETIGEGIIPAHTEMLVAINSNNGAFQELAETISGVALNEAKSIAGSLKQIGVDADSTDEKVSLLSLSFMTVAGACKMAWNGFQLIGRGLIGVGTLIKSGVEMLADYAEALSRLAVLDFSGAAEKAQKGNWRLPNWYADYSAGVKGDISDLGSAFSMVFNPQAQIKQAREALQQYRKEARDAAKDSAVPTGGDGSFGGGGGKDKGASKIASAREQLQKLREEIAAMNGEATKTSNGLAQKEREIEKVGKAAGLSAGEIDSLKTEYGEAFKTNTLKDFNKHIVELEGNAAAIRDLKIEEEVKKWSASFNEFVATNKMSTEEATANIERLKAALAKQAEVKDAQTSLSFIKEYSQLSGDFSNNQKILLEMLDREAEVYRSTLPVSLQPYIDKWKELKALQEARDPFSGLTRGLRTYSNSATDFARNFETLTTSAFGNVEDSFTKMLTTGKLNFTDFTNSLISDLARLATRQFILGPMVGGLGGLMGDMFGSWTTSSATSGAMTDAIGWVKSAHGNVFSGSGISSHSNSVVTGPTLFNFNSMAGTATPPALRPFAKGAGLMGEAGWEAVMPLTRNSHGDLSVNVVGMGHQIARDVSAFVMARGNGGAAAAPQVTVNINNNTNADITQQTRTDNRGNRNIEITVSNMVAGQAMRPGTTMNRVIRQGMGGRTRTEQQ